MSQPSLSTSGTRRVLAWTLLGILALASLGALTYAVVWWRIHEAMKPTTIQNLEPLSLEQARQLSGLAIPESASEIHYACHSEFIVHLELLRFHAPLNDCITFAEQVVADQKRRDPAAQTLGLHRVNQPSGFLLADQLRPLEAPWYLPSSIRNCMQAGELGSYHPRLWIDLDEEVLYYQQTD